MPRIVSETARRLRRKVTDELHARAAGYVLFFFFSPQDSIALP